MKLFQKNTRKKKTYSKSKKWKRGLFIKDMPNSKFKKRKNKRILKFLKHLDINIGKHNIVYIYLWALLLIVWVAAFFILWPYFKIQTINIVRQDNLSNINIAYKSLENIRGTHIMANDQISLEKSIKSYQENIKQVQVSRDLPNKLDIKIKSYEPIFNTKLNQKNYIILENGSFVPEKENPELRNLVIITSKISSSIPDYKNVIEPTYMNQIRMIYDEIKTNMIRINITNMTYYPIEREVIVDIEGGTKLIFDLESSITPQVKRLAVFDMENRKIDLPGIIYIDLRVRDKVFFCTTETEYQCVINLRDIYPQPVVEW